MENTSIIALSLIVFASCNTEKKQESTTKTEVKTTQTETCYQHTKDSSKIRLNVIINDNIITAI